MIRSPFRIRSAATQAKMKLLIKNTDNDGRFALIPELLTTSWTIEVADSSNREELARKILDADAMVSMNWPIDMPPAPRLQLLQLPGAGTDDIAFESVPAQAAICNVYEHEIGIAEYILSAMLQWVIGIPRMDAALRRGHGTARTCPDRATMSCLARPSASSAMAVSVAKSHAAHAPLA
jgi:phosphoglycerate dehydrogenase-like enzyme